MFNNKSKTDIVFWFMGKGFILGLIAFIALVVVIMGTSIASGIGVAYQKHQVSFEQKQLAFHEKTKGLKACNEKSGIFDPSGQKEPIYYGALTDMVNCGAAIREKAMERPGTTGWPYYQPINS